MKLIIGLGNPEEKYKNTRHNIGFRVLTEYAEKKGVSFALKDKFRACVAEITVEGEKVILAKPTTYYNLVGTSARLITDFYKIAPEDVLVVHDELALPFGTIRTRIGGSDAGNNGVKSVSAHLGLETARLRIGVSNDVRERMDDADFVLGGWSKDETEALGDIYAKASDIIDCFIGDSFVVTSHK